MRYADSEMKTNGFGTVDAEEFFPEFKEEEIILAGNRFSSHGEFFSVEEVPDPKSPPAGTNLF